MAELLAPPASADGKQSSVCVHFDAKSLDVVNQFTAKLSESVKRQLKSVQFLKDTVVDDIQILLLCDNDDDGKNNSHGASLEVLHKAKALAALSLLQADSGSATAAPMSGAKKLLQEYLAAAAVRVRDILDTELVVDKKQASSRTSDGDQGMLSQMRQIQPISMLYHRSSQANVYDLFL